MAFPAETAEREPPARAIWQKHQKDQNRRNDGFDGFDRNGQKRARREGILPDLAEKEHKVVNLMTFMTETTKRRRGEKGDRQFCQKEHKVAYLTILFTLSARNGEKKALREGIWRRDDEERWIVRFKKRISLAQVAEVSVLLVLDPL